MVFDPDIALINLPVKLISGIGCIQKDVHIPQPGKPTDGDRFIVAIKIWIRIFKIRLTISLHSQLGNGCADTVGRFWFFPAGEKAAQRQKYHKRNDGKSDIAFHGYTSDSILKVTSDFPFS